MKQKFFSIKVYNIKIYLYYKDIPYTLLRLYFKKSKWVEVLTSKPDSVYLTNTLLNGNGFELQKLVQKLGHIYFLIMQKKV